METYTTESNMNRMMEIVQQTPIAVLCFCSIYAAYYLLCVVKRPTIACRGAGFRRFLDQHVPISKEKFWPTWWCFESRLQTVFRVVLQSNVHVDYKSEFIKTPDGGEIQLDWSYNDESSSFSEETRPTILFLPGLTAIVRPDAGVYPDFCSIKWTLKLLATLWKGCWISFNCSFSAGWTGVQKKTHDVACNSQENYVLNMVKDASDMGYRCVVFINRGLGNSTLKTPRTYCAANAEDTELVIEHIKKRFPQAPLIATGISLGGMILLNYLAKNGDKAKVEAAMAVSVGWNVFAAVDSLTNTPLNYYLFNRTLAKSLCDMVEQHEQMFENHLGIDTSHVLKSKTIQDFDERFTTKVFGYQSLHHYYSEASPDFKIPNITKPVLCLSAADDPFQPKYAIPLSKAGESDNVAIIMPSHGGHIGFLEGTFPRNHNYMNRWFKQYVNAVFSHGIKDL